MASSPQQITPLGVFNYASLQSMMVFWSVDAGLVAPLLAGTGLEPAILDGKALVSLNFERYAGFGSNFSSYVEECEFNVAVFPARRAGQQPSLTVQQYLQGDDQSKVYGSFRINVPCASALAVKAGSEKYGEIKFLASFDYIVPDVNAPGVTAFSIRCYATPAPPTNQLPYIFDLKVSPPGTPTVSPFSPVPAYANLVVNGKKHMVTSGRVIFGVFQSWLPSTPSTSLPAGAATLTVGDATHRMQAEMSSVFKGNPPVVGILLFQSQPAAASGHTLVADVLS
jgi:hypothetical protein